MNERGTSKDPTARTAAGLAGALALILFLATLAPGLTFGDAGELIAAADGLGAAHPPGYPLWTLLAKLALLVPAGEPALRTNVLTALLGALASGMAALLAARWSGSLAAGLVAGLGLALAPGMWASSVATEVYSLHVLLVLALLERADAGGRGGALGAGIVLGLGLAHHPTIVLALPAAAALGWRKSRPGDLLRGAVAAVALPALLYGTLLLRARAYPEASWGTLRSWSDLAAHAQALAYRSYDLGWGALADPGRWAAVARGLVRSTGPAGVLLGLLGWIGPGRGRRTLAAALLSLPSIAFSMRYLADGGEAYLLPAAAGLLLGAGLLAAAAEERDRRAGWAVAALVIVPLLLGAGTVLPLRADRSADGYARDLLRSVPPGGTLVVEGDEAFVLAYRRRVLGDRPDVTVRDRTNGAFPGIGPDEEAALIASGRPVLYQAWPGTDPPPGLRWEPVGLLYRVAPAASPPAADDPLAGGSAEDATGRLAEETGDWFARHVWASYPLMRGERRLFLGDRAGAEREFDLARRRAPDSEALRNYLGTIYGRIGDLPRAEAEFEAAVKARPVSARARANLETARRLMGRGGPP